MNESSGGNTPYSEDELLQQWNFLDAMVERQAASLRSGNQDPEEDELLAPLVAAAGADGAEVVRLRERVAMLESGAAATNNLQDRIAELDAERTKVTDDLDTLRQRLVRRESELARLSHSHSDLLEALRQAHTEVESLRAQLSAAGGRAMSSVGGQAAPGRPASGAESTVPDGAKRRRWFSRK